MTVEIVYTPLDEIAAHPRNPKDHDIGAISQSIGRFGYIAPVIIDERTQLLVAGHGRLDALRAMRGQGQKPPEGVQVDAEGNWRVPVIRGVKFRSDEEVAAYLIADNRLTVGGGVERTRPSRTAAIAARTRPAAHGSDRV